MVKSNWIKADIDAISPQIKHSRIFRHKEGELNSLLENNVFFWVEKHGQDRVSCK